MVVAQRWSERPGVVRSSSPASIRRASSTFSSASDPSVPSRTFRRASSAASSAGARSSWRRIISSALAATRAWNEVAPVVWAATTVFRKAATAPMTSEGVGWSCMSGRQESQEIDFVLRGAPGDHRALDRGVGAPEGGHHRGAHHPPAHGAEHLPEQRVVAFHRRAAGRLIAGPEILALAEAADRLVDHAEAPGIGADPAQVLHRVADMGDLPVEHGADAVGADHQIAVPEIAMHQLHFI